MHYKYTLYVYMCLIDLLTKKNYRMKKRRIYAAIAVISGIVDMALNGHESTVCYGVRHISYPGINCKFQLSFLIWR